MRHPESGRAVRDAIECLPELVNGCEARVFRGRKMTMDLMLAVERERLYLPIRSGRIESVVCGTPILRSADLSFVAEAKSWLAHWQPVPAPGEHDIFALVKDERMAIEGDMKLLMRHLQNLKDILAAPRALFAEI